MSHQPILSDLFHPLELVSQYFGQQLRPNEPVDDANSEYGPTSHSMCPVGKFVVGFSVGWWFDEGNDEEEDVGGSEEGGGRDCPYGYAWPIRVGSEVKVDDAKGDRCIDDGEWI